jgi:hypothetical protein
MLQHEALGVKDGIQFKQRDNQRNLLNHYTAG